MNAGVVGRAIDRGLIDVRVHDLRDHTHDRHRVVDDMPFGGGPGMVLKAEPLFAAVDGFKAARGTPAAILLTSPDGDRFTQETARRPAAVDHLVVLLCGRYEGCRRAGANPPGDRDDVDRRLRRLGRRTAGAGDCRRGGAAGPGGGWRRGSRWRAIRSRAGCSTIRSTRGRRSSGDGGAAGAAVGAPREIESWRRREALARTLERRPDLLAGLALDAEDAALLKIAGRSAARRTRRATEAARRVQPAREGAGACEHEGE